MSRSKTLTEAEQVAVEQYCRENPEAGRRKVRAFINSVIRPNKPVGGTVVKNFLKNIGHKSMACTRTPVSNVTDDEYNDKDYQIQLITNELTACRKSLKEARKQWFTDKHFAEMLGRELGSFEVPKRLPIHKPKKRTVKEEEAVLLLGDLHAGKTVAPVEVEYMNEFNFDILCRRLWDVLDSTMGITDMMRDNMKLETLNFIMLGDMLNDIHRDENKKTNEFPEFVTVMLLASVLGQTLSTLSTKFSDINVYGVVGNEARVTKRPESALRYNNLDWLVYRSLQTMMVNNPRVHFNIPHSPKYVINIQGWNVLLQHGDDAFSGTGGYGGVPWYSLHRTKLQENFDRIDRHLQATECGEDSGFGGIDYLFMGHKHPKELTWDNTIINGSMVGIDPYAGNKLTRRSPPRQRFFGMNKKYGKSWDYNLYCSDKDPHGFIYDAGDPVDEEVLADL